MKLRKDVIWITMWIIGSTIFAFLAYALCEDIISRCFMGAIAYMFVMIPYSVCVIWNIMPINKETFYYIETLFYIAINFFALACIPHVYVSIFLLLLVIVPRIIKNFK